MKDGDGMGAGDEDTLHNDARAHPGLMQSSILFQRTTCLVPNHIYSNHQSSYVGSRKFQSTYNYLLVAACNIGLYECKHLFLRSKRTRTISDIISKEFDMSIEILYNPECTRLFYQIL